MSEHKIQEILLFWFGDAFTEQFPPRSVSDKWYHFQSTTDALIKKQFLSDVNAALSGTYDDWAGTAKGRLALIILLDQFTRHIYRNTAQAFSGDEKALALVHEALHAQLGEELLLCEKMFYFGPLEHSEQLSDQQQHKDMYENMIKGLPKRVVDKFAYYLYWFNVHYDVVYKYGRFPWRNDILGRKSTDAEKEYLKNAPDFGQN